MKNVEGAEEAKTLSIEEIIEAQGWNEASVNDLLFSYIENQGSMDALRDFLEKAAGEENSSEQSPPHDAATATGMYDHD
jgi:hypothetical protein